MTSSLPVDVPDRPPTVTPTEVRRDLRLLTTDGVTLRAALWAGPGAAPRGTVVVLAHGFSGHLEKDHLLRMVAGLAEHCAVLAVELRGHGRSGGRSTLGDREVLDLDVAVASARAHGFTEVVTVGFSMGGSVVLRHAALVGDETLHAVDAVVAVSAPSRWYVRDTVPMRRLHWLVERRLGRVVARHVLRTRISAAGWDPLPPSPVELVGRIAPVPLLLVHGDSDAYFTVEHPRALHAAAGAPVELWLEEGLGHAESAVGTDLLSRIGAHLPALLAQRATGVTGVPAQRATGATR